MPIVDGKYEARLKTYYASPADGIEAVKKKLQRSRRVRISNVPRALLEDLAPLLEGKDLKVILPEGDRPDEKLKNLGEYATTRSRIYVDYMGKEANAGAIDFSDRSFNVVWSGDRILCMDSIEYPKCARCLLDTFDMAWKYSQKW